MAYIVRHDGTIECGSADEALELQAKIMLRLHIGNGGAIIQPPVASNGDDDVAITGLGRRFLKLVLENSGITSEAAAEQLETTTASFPPMYRSIRAWATRRGIDPDRLFTRLLGEQGSQRQLQIDQQYRSIVEAAVRD